MSSANRQAPADATATLGKLITENEKRDAIHFAVEPAVAARFLKPGDHVGFDPGYEPGTVGRCANPLGIVDPFLESYVNPGERFWLVLYPRTITSLRHVWTHPAFPDEPEAAPTAPSVVPQVLDEKAASEAWIREFAESIDQGYKFLMEAADEYITSGDYVYMGQNEGYKNRDDWDEFWRHYKVLTGREPKETGPWSFFSCSC